MFQCKLFSVIDAQSSMKVGTDAVLLASWVEVKGVKHILDVGCGCGIISLLLAQRTESEAEIKIMAIDLHAHSCQDASTNFLASPWASRLQAKPIRFQDLETEFKYDLIVSNPPFFSHSLHAKDAKRALARHNDSLSFTALCRGVVQRLSSHGRFCLILPTTENMNFENAADEVGLKIHKRYFVSHMENSKPKRILYELGMHEKECEEKHCFLFNKGAERSKWYGELTKEIYIR